MKIGSFVRAAGTTRDGLRRELDDLPGPRGLPLLGNLHQIDSGKLHLILEGWAAQYGPTYQIRIGRRRLIVITDPKWCDQILRARPETFSRGAVQSAIFSEMNLDGVFSSEGDSWRRQRKLTAAPVLISRVGGLGGVAQRGQARGRRRLVLGASLITVLRTNRIAMFLSARTLCNCIGDLRQDGPGLRTLLPRKKTRRRFA